MTDASLIPMRAPEDRAAKHRWCVLVAQQRFDQGRRHTQAWFQLAQGGRVMNMRVTKHRPDAVMEVECQIRVPAHRVLRCKTSAQLIELLETEVAIETVRRAGQ